MIKCYKSIPVFTTKKKISLSFNSDLFKLRELSCDTLSTNKRAAFGSETKHREILSSWRAHSYFMRVGPWKLLAVNSSQSAVKINLQKMPNLTHLAPSTLNKTLFSILLKLKFGKNFNIGPLTNYLEFDLILYILKFCTNLNF